MALMCSLPRATALVPVTVPLVNRVTELVEVPPVAMTRNGVLLNSAAAAISKAFLASFFSTLLITSFTGCSDRSSSLPV